MRPLAQKVALVTGAGRGIGRDIALALAERGWFVVINYRRDEHAATETLGSVQAAGGCGMIVQADVADSSDRNRLVQATLAEGGQLNLLVNNAGIAPRMRRDLLELTEESYEEVMAVNLKGPFFLTQLVARVMIDQRNAGFSADSAIINLGSLSAYTSSTNRGEYCLSKAGVAMMTKLYADRLSRHGIRVYEIRPGIIATDMTQSVKEKYDQLIAAGLTPLARWGQPMEVAQAVVALAEGYFPFSTGEVINVDGGFHLRRL